MIAHKRRRVVSFSLYDFLIVFFGFLVGRWKKLSDGFFLALSLSLPLSLSLSLSLSRPWRIIFFGYFSSALFLQSMLLLQYVFVYDRSLHFSRFHAVDFFPAISIC